MDQPSALPASSLLLSVVPIWRLLPKSVELLLIWIVYVVLAARTVFAEAVKDFSTVPCVGFVSVAIMLPGGVSCSALQQFDRWSDTGRPRAHIQRDRCECRS